MVVGEGVEIKYEPTGSMWCDILTKPKQGSVFRKFRGHLMNVPMDYDDDAERLRTHPLLLPKEDKSETMSTADKHVLKKTTNNFSFAPDVKLTQRILLRPKVPRLNKEQEARQKSMPQRVTNQVALPLKHCRSVLADQLLRSPNRIEHSCDAPAVA